jgi:hypothetical protein
VQNHSAHARTQPARYQSGHPTPRSKVSFLRERRNASTALCTTQTIRGTLPLMGVPSKCCSSWTYSCCVPTLPHNGTRKVLPVQGAAHPLGTRAERILKLLDLRGFHFNIIMPDNGKQTAASARRCAAAGTRAWRPAPAPPHTAAPQRSSPPARERAAGRGGDQRRCALSPRRERALLALNHAHAQCRACALNQVGGRRRAAACARGCCISSLWR